MKPVLFVDLDRTLFDSDAFFAHIEKLLKTKCHVSDGDYDKVRHLLAVPKEDKLLRFTDFDAILHDLHVSKDIFQQLVIEETHPDAFILPDALEFINWLHTQKNFEVRILSFGQYYFQMLKILVSPLLNEFPEHIIFTRKNEFIATELTKRTGVLVDDKPNQELPSGWLEIYIDRKATKYNKPTKLSESVVCITTLDDAPKTISSVY
jgi:hypothetical protein